MVSRAGNTFSRARVMFEAGELQQAGALCRRILDEEPNNADVLDLLGLVEFRLGNFAGAGQLVMRAVATCPNVANYRVHLGQVFRAAGNSAAAIASCEDALRLSPNSDYANNCLGIALLEESRFADALDCFELAVRAAPGNSDAHSNRGIALFELERYEEAVSSYDRAVAIDPVAAGPLTNLGNVLQVMGRLDEAEVCYLKALRLQPSSKEAQHSLGNFYRALGRLEEAATRYLAAIELDAAFVPAHRGLGNVREQQERFTQARNSYRVVETLQPHFPLGCLRNMTMCPTVFHRNAEIDEYRRRLLTDLERFSHKDFQVDLPEVAMVGEAPPFNLMYHGRNDLVIKKAYANLFRHRMPKMCPLPATGKARLGFVVTQGHEIAFAHCMGHVLEQLSEHDFDVEVVCTTRSASAIRTTLGHDLLRFALVPQRLDRAAEAICEHRFDLLYYWEIGSDTTNYFLPHLRLAPIQCTSWGVPVTSGIPTVDYYISSRLLETESNADDYTEQLINLDTLPSLQPRTTAPAPPRSRASLGVTEGHSIYLCAQNLAKVHPDFDALVGNILRTDSSGRVVFLADRLGYVAQRLDERLRRSVPDVANRISFLPRREAPDYRCLLAASDVLLDTIHYGGVMTTYDALALAKPIVTLAGSDQRGRYATACYRQLGIAGCVATSAEEYVAIASRLGMDPEYRRSVVQQVTAASDRLFGDDKVVPSYVVVLHKLLATTGRL